MTNDSVDGLSTTIIIDRILNQTLEEAISSISTVVDDDVIIPMAFIDPNCVVILNACKVPQTFESLGELCVHANKVANYKYGENKAKLMEQIGVLSIDTQDCPHRVIITDVGNCLLLMEKDVAISAMVRLTVRIPAIHMLLSESSQAQINVASVFSDYYSYTTVRRRSSSIIHIIRDIEKEYNTSGYSNRLIVSRYSIDQAADRCTEDYPSLIDSTNDSGEEINIASVELVHEPNEGSHTVLAESTSDCQVVEGEVATLPEQLVLTSYCPCQESCYKAEKDSSSVIMIDDASNNSQGMDSEVPVQHVYDLGSGNKCWKLRTTHTLLSKIKSFINRFFVIRKESKVSSMLESLLNIIEDPSSEYITQTLAYLPLGYFVKYGRLTEQSHKEVECACFVSLLRIYEINMNLMIYNLSSGFSLNDFYDIRETYAVRYGSILQDVRNHMCIDNFFNRVAEEAVSEEYHTELEQLYTSESNLYYRLATEGTEMLDEQSFMRSMQIISQSRLEYPVGGIDSKYVPILENDDTESYHNSMKECILSEIEESINIDKISILWDYGFEDWHDTINELLLLAYVLSPHRIIQRDDIDIMYAVCQAIVDKTDCCDDGEVVSTVNACYELYVSRMPDDLQIKIMNRVNSILIYNILITDFLSITTYIRDDIACITRICNVVDKKSGRNARYKSRLGIGSSLNIFEKTDVRQIRRHREYTDSERSRKNRYMNKTRYDDE